MNMSKFENIATELRLNIYSIIFKGAFVEFSSRPWEIRIQPNDVVKKSASVLVLNSKIYREARPILAASIMLNLYCNCVTSVGAHIKDFYFPLIKEVRIFGCVHHPHDLTAFVGMKIFLLFPTLRDCHCNERYAYTEMLSWGFNVPSDRLLITIGEGAADETVKKNLKAALLQAANWLTTILDDQKRDCRVICFAYLSFRDRSARLAPKEVIFVDLYLLVDLKDLTASRVFSTIEYRGRQQQLVGRAVGGRTEFTLRKENGDQAEEPVKLDGPELGYANVKVIGSLQEGLKVFET